ncbi:hypothetical protein KKC87_04525 [Patescibacteria group bacterium]|nr:hypothetical protein [Patescibacteria group bacterium]
MTEKIKMFPNRKQRFSGTSIAVFVPSTTRKSRKISKREFRKRVQATQKFLNGRFGGSTKFRAKGSFILTRGKGKGKLVQEDVALVEGYVFKDNYTKKDKVAMDNFLDKNRKAWQQESLAVEFKSPKNKEAIYFVEED